MIHTPIQTIASTAFKLDDTFEFYLLREHHLTTLKSKIADQNKLNYNEISFEFDLITIDPYCETPKHPNVVSTIDIGKVKHSKMIFGEVTINCVFTSDSKYTINAFFEPSMWQAAQ